MKKSSKTTFLVCQPGEYLFPKTPTNKHWKQRYVKRLILNGYTAKQARENLKTINKIDLQECPESLADDEASYG